MQTTCRARLFYSCVLVTVLVVSISCRPRTDFVLVQADRKVSGSSKYPTAVDPQKVGTYPAGAKSGAGYFYDDVLEYRVWLHPEHGAIALNGDQDYYYAFAEYEKAESFSTASTGAEPP